MKRAWSVLACTGLVLALLACASTGGGTKGMTTYGQFRILDVDYVKIFSATQDYLVSNLNLVITKADMETGEIETDYRLNFGLKPDASVTEESDDYDVSGTGVNPRAKFRGERRGKVKAKVSKLEDGKVKLILEVFTEYRNVNSSEWKLITGYHWTERFTYDRYFDYITRAAQGMVEQE